jgi:hypothetical protein
MSYFNQDNVEKFIVIDNERYCIESECGDKYWYKNGKLHREDGPAIERANGTNVWYKNDKLHREDGPAIEFCDGMKIWHLDGEKHREDGPAVECVNGYKEWWVNGVFCSKENYYERFYYEKPKRSK